MSTVTLNAIVIIILPHSILKMTRIMLKKHCYNHFHIPDDIK